jgi:hypothetical protein
MSNQTFRADERLNDLNDADDMWGPLLFLRPERHQRIAPGRSLVICAALGAFYGMLGNVVLALLLRNSGSSGKPSVLLMPLVLTAVYFVCAQVSVVAAWNRRATQVSRRKGWEELTRRAPPPAGDDEQEPSS